MVQVPRQPTRRTQTRTPSPVFRESSSVPSGAFGDRGAALSASARGLGDFADDMQRLVLQMQQEDNETKAKEADTRIAGKMREIMFGNPSQPDSAPGFLTTRGKTTVDSLGEAEQRARAAIEQELTAAGGNKQLRMMINDAGTSRLNTALDRMTLYAGEQRIAHQEETSLARESQALADASSDWNDDTLIDNALSVVAAEVSDRAEAQGMSPEAKESLRAQRQSIVVKGAFDAALASQDVARAQAIFSQHADKLDGPTRTTMAQALAKDTLEVQAQSLAQEAVALHPADRKAARKFIRDAVDGAQESAAIAEYRRLLEEQEGDFAWQRALREARRSSQAESRPARAQSIVEDAQSTLGADASPSDVRRWIRENYSGQDEDAALNEYNARLSEANADVERARAAEREARILEQNARAEANHAYTVKERERRDRLREASKSGYSAIDGGKSVTQWRREDPESYNIMAEEGQIESLVDTMRAVQEGKLFADSSDGVTLGKLLSLPTSELALVDHVAERRLLTQSEHNKLITAISSARRKLEANEQDRAVYNAGETALRSFAPGSLLDGTDRAKAHFNTANTLMSEWISARIERGKVPTQPEIDAEAARLMMRVEVDSTDFSSPYDFARTYFDGIESWEGLASQAGALSPEQKAIARVPRDMIPQEILNRIDRSLSINAPGLDRNLVTDDVLEQLAGALAVGDQDRFAEIVEELESGR